MLISPRFIFPSCGCVASPVWDSLCTPPLSTLSTCYLFYFTLGLHHYHPHPLLRQQFTVSRRHTPYIFFLYVFVCVPQLCRVSFCLSAFSCLCVSLRLCLYRPACLVRCLSVYLSVSASLHVGDNVCITPSYLLQVLTLDYLSKERTRTSTVSSKFNG